MHRRQATLNNDIGNTNAHVYVWILKIKCFIGERLLCLLTERQCQRFLAAMFICRLYALQNHRNKLSSQAIYFLFGILLMMGCKKQNSAKTVAISSEHEPKEQKLRKFFYFQNCPRFPLDLNIFARSYLILYANYPIITLVTVLLDTFKSISCT